MKKQYLLILAIVVAVGTVCWRLGMQQAASEAKNAADARDTPPAPPDRTAGSSRSADAPPVQTMRDRVAAVIAKEVTHLKAEREIAQYLETLKERAVRQQRVTALEVQPGVAALQTLESDLGPDEMNRRIDVFTSEMAALSKQFGHAPDPPPPPTPGETDAMLQKIAGEQDEEKKRQAVGDYLDRVRGTGNGEAEAALMLRLDETLPKKRTPSSEPDIDLLLNAVETAEDNDAKQTAVHEYLERTRALPSEEQAAAQKRLDGLVGGGEN